MCFCQSSHFGALSEISNPGSFWQGFATSGIVAGANHAAHYGIQKSQDKWLINRYNNGEKLDLSRRSKMLLQIQRGARLAHLHTRVGGHEDLQGPMRMGDIFDFDSMSKSYSGWEKAGGAWLENYVNETSPGMTRAVLQNSDSPINSVAFKNSGKNAGELWFYDSLSTFKPVGRIYFDNSTIYNQSFNFIFYGRYNR